ncbi:MAG: hypothetical protein PHY16_18930 [Methylobacter sp.]|nr:hypothetical protein [Methylobacter sp.]
MKNIPTAPRTNRDALAALVVGEIDTLLDKLDALQGHVNATGENIQITINKLEAAGESYNQAVLAANCRSKNEMFEYLKTISATIVAKTYDEQRVLVQKLIRDAVSDEIIALKRAISDSSEYHQGAFLSSWGKIVMGCTLTALMTGAITVELIQRLVIF